MYLSLNFDDYVFNEISASAPAAAAVDTHPQQRDDVYQSRPVTTDSEEAAICDDVFLRYRFQSSRSCPFPSPPKPIIT